MGWQEELGRTQVNLSRRQVLKYGGSSLAGLGLGWTGLLTGCGSDARILEFRDRQAALDSCPTTLLPDPSLCNGADWAPAINAAIQAAASCGGHVILEPGTYEYYSAINIVAGVTLRSALPLVRCATLHNPSGADNSARINVGSAAQVIDLIIRGPGAQAAGSQLIGVNSGLTESWNVLNCEIYDFPYSGINTGGDCRWPTVWNCDIHDNGNVGIQIGAGCYSCFIRNNRTFNNGCNGIDCNGSYCIIEGNETFRNGWQGTSDSQGIHVWGPNNDAARNRIERNSVYENHRAGIAIVHGTSQNRVFENQVFLNMAAGIWVEGGVPSGPNLWTEIRSNVIRDNGYLPSGLPSGQEGFGIGWGSQPGYNDVRDACVLENTFRHNYAGASWCHPGAIFIGNTSDGQPFTPCG